MFHVGESVYRNCEAPRVEAVTSGIPVACPFQAKGWDMKNWCKTCLISKIESFRTDLLGVAERATTAVKVLQSVG